MARPIPGNVPRRQSPAVDPPSQPKRWTFSFRYWRQIDNFGLTESDSKWFVSLLDRLVELSKISLDEFLADTRQQDAWRFHDIDWTATNIPIQRDDLNWIPAAYLSNAVEYPLRQFMVSMALGRVVGFLDETLTFNVVLLDPLHNIQPAGGRFAYRIKKNYPLSCQHTEILRGVQDAQRVTCNGRGCPAHAAIMNIGLGHARPNVVILMLDDQAYADAMGAIADGIIVSLEACLERGIYAFLDDPPTPE